MLIITRGGTIIPVESIRNIKKSFNERHILACYGSKEDAQEIVYTRSSEICQILFDILREALLEGFNVNFYQEDYEKKSKECPYIVEELTPQIKRVVVGNTMYFLISD